LKILFYATVLATFIFFLNFAVFQLLDIFVRTGIFWNFYWIVPLEGLVMAIAAVLNLTNIGDLARRFPPWRSPFQELIHTDEMRLGRHVVASIMRWRVFYYSGSVFCYFLKQASKLPSQRKDRAILDLQNRLRKLQAQVKRM